MATRGGNGAPTTQGLLNTLRHTRYDGGNRRMGYRIFGRLAGGRSSRKSSDVAAPDIRDGEV